MRIEPTLEWAQGGLNVGGTWVHLLITFGQPNLLQDDELTTIDPRVREPFLTYFMGSNTQLFTSN